MHEKSESPSIYDGQSKREQSSSQLFNPIAKVVRRQITAKKKIIVLLFIEGRVVICIPNKFGLYFVSNRQQTIICQD
jgi:hypothetical protein